MTAARDSLEARLLAAHAAGERNALVRLYEEAADATYAEAAGFYLTQAYIYALEAGDPVARRLHARLKCDGREA